MARWRTMVGSGAACGHYRNYPQAQAKLMQQQQNYRHSVDSGDYFLIEMMTNLPSLATGSAAKEKKDGNKWFQRRERRGGEEQREKPGKERKWLEAWTLPPRWLPPCSNQPADRAVSHTQVMAGRPTLTFHKEAFASTGTRCTLLAWLGNIQFFFFQELRTKSLALERGKIGIMKRPDSQRQQ